MLFPWSKSFFLGPPLSLGIKPRVTHPPTRPWCSGLRFLSNSLLLCPSSGASSQKSLLLFWGQKHSPALGSLSWFPLPCFLFFYSVCKFFHLLHCFVSFIYLLEEPSLTTPSKIVLFGCFVSFQYTLCFLQSLPPPDSTWCYVFLCLLVVWVWALWKCRLCLLCSIAIAQLRNIHLAQIIY